MASKKKTARKPAKRATSKAKPAITGAKGKEHDCTPPDICDYLKELSEWLRDDFLGEYKKLRVAVCNLDHEVFGAGGNMADRLCTGGTAGEPTQPPDTPVW